MKRFIKIENGIICLDGRDSGYRIQQIKGGTTVVTNPIGKRVQMPHPYYRIDTNFAVGGKPAWGEFVNDFLAIVGTSQGR